MPGVTMLPPEPLLNTLFFVSTGLVLHSYVFYPLILAVLGARPARAAAVLADEDLPFVTLLVAAHNEAQVIGTRVENALACDYPAERFEVLIASDGSSDGTEAIVEAFDDPRVRLLAHHPNRGKSWTLNRALPEARGEVIVMSDANTQFAPDALRELVGRLYAEDRPLAVCGKLVLTDPVSGNNVDGLYWRYESWMKHREGALGATLGANGGIYAIRKADYCPIPDNTILDDMSIPLLMKLQHGGDVVFHERAQAFEEVPPHLDDEFERRVRISAGAYQSLGFLWPLLHPRHGYTAFGFLSHKLLRWLTPHLLLLAALVAVVGLAHPFYQLALAGMAALLLLAWLGRRVEGGSAKARLLRLVSLFVSMNAALFMGFLRWLRSPQAGTWKRTTRESA
jgi:cellulose synthase/poly-beta-1,6-N-acetylglucosamine synthase-like glycosyltransferase